MMARTCDACAQLLPDGEFIELTARVLLTAEGQEQAERQQWIGDYCEPCLASGKALGDLLSARAAAEVQLDLEVQVRAPVD